MKSIRMIGALSLALAIPGAALAQAPEAKVIEGQRAAMARFSRMDGEWRGPAVTMTPAGERRVMQTERIGSFLDGTLKVIEGKGFNADGKVGFHAFGVISWNPAANRYDFHSYAQGRAGTFEITPTTDGYVWEIPMGPATVRYTATINGGKYREIGERIVAGAAPQKFFEMNLVRIGDTKWPEEGALRPR